MISDFEKTSILDCINERFHYCLQEDDDNFMGHLLDIYDGYKISLDDLSLCMSDENCLAKHFASKCIGILKRMEKAGNL